MDRIDKIKNEISGILSILLGIVILLSLLTHTHWDPSPFTYPNKVSDIKNLLGPFGSYLSDILLQTIGLSSYVIPAILSIYGLRRILNKGAKQRVFVVIGVAVLILSLSSLFSLILKVSSGGILGFLLTRLSLGILSTTGSYLLFISLILATSMFLLPFSVVEFINSVKNKFILKYASISGREEQKTAERITEKEPQPIETRYPQEEPVVKIPTYKQEQLPLLGYPEPRQRHIKQKTRDDYELPYVELLKNPPPFKARPTKEDILQSSSLLEKKLQDFSIEGKVTYVSPGPVVTMFEFEPAPGIKIQKVMSLADDLALALKSVSVRVLPIHGRATLGIEVPNKEREDVFLKDIISSEAFRKSQSKLTLALGKDIFGNPVVTELSRMPHLLIAGATGSGKSVAMSSMVLSLLYRTTPKELKMLMIDPKMLELPAYEGISHLLLPVITSPKDATESLKKAVLEMERRYNILAESGARNIEAYNKKIKSASVGGEPLPYIVIFIDELADLMLISAYEVEDSIARLAQMARAAGIHLILATQRPSVDVITGLIKANFPSRISFQVSSKLDSRIILDTYGAERLLGKGDMLLVSPGIKTLRVHGAYVSEEEIKVVVDFIKAQGSPDYSLFEEFKDEDLENSRLDEADELYQEARDLILSTGQASISFIQRRLKIGYNRAARIMEMMEEEGIVGPPAEAGKPREIIRRKK
ncbi:MAG: DNA translocase FtsK 4TM domain-containing protein [Nitrospirae bacterium]|nr:DNA translocase FtsK 4TM domain-containing protein [Nitrospirota bacterium]